MTPPKSTTALDPFPRDSLDHIWQTCWERLALSVTDLAHPWRTPVLGTWEGTAPQLRTVVLRQVLIAERELWFYTDARSPKVQQLAAYPAATWLFYDPGLKVQLRIQSQAVREEDPGLLFAGWNSLRETAQREYLAPLAPGSQSPVIENLPPAPEPVQPAAGADSASVTESHFAILRCRVTSIDFLQLDPVKHLRANFTATETGLSAVWLTP